MCASPKRYNACVEISINVQELLFVLQRVQGAIGSEENLQQGHEWTSNMRHESEVKA
jgi:hypothetical protein